MAEIDSPPDCQRPIIPINVEVARLLDTIAALMEFKDENPFKVRAYSAAGDAVEDMKESIRDVADRGGEAALQEISGIGKAISKQIAEFLKSGTCSALDELTKELPLSVLELTKVSGVGLKTARTLFHNFGIKSLADLKTFADGGGLKSVPGLGDKTTARVLRSIERLTSSGAAPSPAEEAPQSQ